MRERAGLFDVSHMGQIQLDGPEAVATAERLRQLSGRLAARRPRALRAALQRRRRLRRRRDDLPGGDERALPLRERGERREGPPLDPTSTPAPPPASRTAATTTGAARAPGARRSRESWRRSS